MEKLKSLKKNNCKTKKTFKKTFKKSHKKIKITNKKVIKGGVNISKFVAKGSFGCVYKDPPIQCNIPCPENQKKKCQRGISKLMSEKNALEEKGLIDNLFENFIIDKSTRKNISHYFITNPHYCEPLESSLINEKCTLSITKPSLLIYENGGLDLFRFWEIILSRYNFFLKKYLLFILNNLTNILKAIGLLLKNHILHKDIKIENIVIGLKENNFRLIDFGLSIKYRDIIECLESLNNSNIICNNLLDKYTIDSFFNLPVYTFFLNDKLKKLGESGSITEEEENLLLNNIYVYYPKEQHSYKLFTYFLCSNNIPNNHNMYATWLIMKFILEKHKNEHKGYLIDTTDPLSVNDYLYRLYLNFLNNNLNPVQRFLKIIERIDYYAFGLMLVELFFKYLEKITGQNYLTLEYILQLYNKKKNNEVKVFLDFIYYSRLLEFDLNIDLPSFETIFSNYQTMIQTLTKL